MSASLPCGWLIRVEAQVVRPTMLPRKLYGNSDASAAPEAISTYYLGVADRLSKSALNESNAGVSNLKKVALKRSQRYYHAIAL